LSIQNKGLNSISHSRNLDKYITPETSCEYDLQEQERGGIRIKVLFDYIYVFKKEAGDVSYRKCSVSQIRDPYFHHMAIVSNNLEHDRYVSNIDIDSITFKNWDNRHYQDENWLAQERLELTADKADIARMEDGTFHP
jgi:hypothetical protein